MNNMKKVKQSAYFLLFVSLIMIVGLTASCKEDDQSNSGEVELNSFGPCPIPRGGELRIIGKNLDQVGSVILPGCDAISEFKSKTVTEIRLIVPKSAEDGQIKLMVGNRQEITSLTNLAIDGSIVLTRFSPLTAKAGVVIKLEGEDLDFANEVVFTSDIHILKDDFVSHSKVAIEVILPVDAQSGRVAISGTTVQGNQVSVYYEVELDVILPTITSLSHETIKAGNVLTITGKDFDLVESVGFGGGKVAESFIMNEAGTSITVTVPKDAQDGTVVLAAISGVKVSSATELIMLMPTITSITPPSPVKVGDELTVTGTDLDLISGVAFGDGKQPGTILPGGTATEIKIPVPGTARDGKIVFSTLANKTVTWPEELIIIQEGTKLLLWEGSVGPIDWNADNCYVGPIDLSQLAPGQIMGIDFECDPGAGYWQMRVMGGSWWENLPSWVATHGELKSFAIDDTNVEFVITQEDIDCISKQGTSLLCCGNGIIIKSVYVKVKEMVLWEGSVGPIDWSGSHLTPVDVSDMAPGKILGIDFECSTSTDYWQLRLMGAWWGGLPTLMDMYGGGTNDYTISFESDDTNFELVLSQDDIDVITNQNKSLLFCGNGLVIKRVYMK
jgi:hypothetical protein